MRRLFLFLVGIMVVANIFAQETIPNSNVTWKLQNGVLTLEGAEGKNPPYNTPDWDYEPGYYNEEEGTDVPGYTFLPPWYYRMPASIKKVVIGEGICVDGHAFYGLSKLEKISVGCSGEILDFRLVGGNLKEIEIMSRCANSCSGFQFGRIDDLQRLQNIILRVPAEMCEVYANWHGFSNIVCGVMVSCPDPIETGQIDNLTWKICPADEWGFYLTISGDGEIPYMPSVPWQQYRGNIRNVYIEEGVTGIGDLVFQNHSTLERVYIPSTVMKLNGSSFITCTNLIEFNVNRDNTHFCSDENGILYNFDKTVLIKYPAGKPESSFDVPDGVTEIPNDAFAFCSNLNSIVISKNVSNIEEWAFEHCRELQSFDVNEENLYFSSVDGILYNKDKTTLFNYPLGKTEQSFTVPQSVQTIGRRAFTNNWRLQSIILPDGLQQIEDDALNTCSEITSISIPASVQHIGRVPFVLCDKLTSIDVSEENANYISIAGVLYNKDTTSLIQYPPAKADRSFSIPQSVNNIETGAFTLAYNLHTIKVLWENPVGISNNVFDYGRASKLNEKTLLVPAGTIERYRNAAVWKDFGTITDVAEIIFTATAGGTRHASDYTGGDIVFESDDTAGTGQLINIPDGGLQVNGKVKLVKEFTTNKWYPAGFPFEIESVSIKQGGNTWNGVIYSRDNDRVGLDNINSATDDNYFVKYYDGTNNVFLHTDHFVANKGYIIKFPEDPFEAGKVEATFTSVANPVIHSTSGTVGAYHESRYTLVVNPNVAHTGSLHNAVHYYQYNYENQFVKVNTLSSLKPFEATVVYHHDGTTIIDALRVINANNGTTGINHPEDGKVVRTEYYNLMGTPVGINDFSPARSGIYLVKTVYESGKIKTEKQIIKK